MSDELGNNQSRLDELNNEIGVLRNQLTPLEKERKKVQETIFFLMLNSPINPNTEFDINGDIKRLGIIEELGNTQGVKLISFLQNAGIRTVADLLLYTFDELLKLPSIGRQQIRPIIELLHSKGWTLGQTEEILVRYGYKK